MGEHGGEATPLGVPARKRIPYLVASAPKYIHTELGIGYRMLEE